MGEYEIRSCPYLYRILKEENDKNLKERRKELPKYEYPSSVVTATKIAYFSKYGQEFFVKKEECIRISELESQKESGKAIFGGGYLISEGKSAEVENLSKAAAEKAAAEKWRLSPKEIRMIKSLK